MAPPATSRPVLQGSTGDSWLDRSGATKQAYAPITFKPQDGGPTPWVFPGRDGQSDFSSFYEVPLRPKSRAELPPITARPALEKLKGALQPEICSEQSEEATRNAAYATWLQELRQENIWASTSSLHSSKVIAWQSATDDDVLNSAMPVVPPSLKTRPVSPGRPRQKQSKSPKVRTRTKEAPRARSKQADSQEAVRKFLKNQGPGGQESKDDSRSNSATQATASGKLEPAAEVSAHAPKGGERLKGRQRNSILHVGAPSVLVSAEAAAHSRESACRRSKFCGDGKQHEGSEGALSRRDTSEAPENLLVSEDLAPTPSIRRRSWLAASDESSNNQESEQPSRTGSKSILHCTLGEQVWKVAERKSSVRRAYQFKPAKPQLSERMKRLEVRRTDRMKQIRSERQHELKVRQFNEMPEDERAALTQAFNTFDEDKSGYLEYAEVLACLREFGLAGVTPEEKREILEICTDATTASHPCDESKSAPFSSEDSERKVAIDILELALTVVPQVRNQLVELRGDELLRHFFRYDLDGSGKLSQKECQELARDMGLDPRMVAAEGKVDSDEVDFELFQEMIEKGREQLARVVRDRERECQRHMGLPESAFQDFREDLISLHDIFVRYDKDDSGTLSKVEMNFMLKEFGLQPTSIPEKEAIEGILRNNDLDMNGEMNFIEFLDVVRQIRAHQQEKRKDQQLERFLKYDKDRSGSLSHSETSMLLADLGFIPSTRKEQEELAYLISSVDTDGSGFIDFSEFQHLCQRIDERLKSFRYEEEVEYAMRLGFTEKQMRDLRWVFDSLDIDGSNKLDATEVRNGLVMMRKHVSTESFESSFRSLDKDGSGELDFTEFLSFMRMMRDGEGISSEETQKLATKAKNLDTRILRRVLEIFKLAKRYINSLGHDELVDLFCVYFKVGPSANLHEVLDIKTVGELYELARAKDKEMAQLIT